MIPDKLIKARMNLLFDQPFFGTLAMRLQMIENNNLAIPTMGVDGVHLFYDANFVQTTSIKNLTTVIAHEVLHCALLHVGSIRMQHREPHRWNIAIDYAANALLVAEQFDVIAAKGLFDPEYNGLSAEHIYTLLPEQSDEQTMDSHIELANTEHGASQLEADWKSAVAQATKQGSVSAGIKRLFKHLEEPAINWKAELREFAVQQAKDDYSWSRANKHYFPLILPGLYSEAMGPIAVIGDTSGSIDGPTFDAFSTEIISLVAETRPETAYIISCDARITNWQEFPRGDVVVPVFKGGGGTDFRPPFAELEKRGIEPVCLIYLTDGYGTFGNPPAYPVLWVITTDVQPPWGQCLRIEI